MVELINKFVLDNIGIIFIIQVVFILADFVWKAGKDAQITNLEQKR